MAHELQIFESQDFGSLRTIIINGVPWFHAADICKVLDLQNPTMVLKRVNDSDKTKHSLGQGSDHNFVNESGLYAMVLMSRKPEAERFKFWVTSDVLPSIRKHGSYLTDNALDRLIEDPDTFIRLLTEYKVEKQRRLQAEQEAALLIVKVQKDEPKVLFADSVAASHQSILVGELAKFLRQNGIEIGQNRLFEYLRDNGFLIKTGESRNMPTQRSMESGLFEIKERTFNDPSGNIHITRTTKVTGKGQIYFVNHFLGRKEREI